CRATSRLKTERSMTGAALSAAPVTPIACLLAGAADGDHLIVSALATTLPHPIQQLRSAPESWFPCFMDNVGRLLTLQNKKGVGVSCP
ncbi:MAG: hypothetical protein AAAB14_05600, partial [Ensifer adhaerens]